MADFQPEVIDHVELPCQGEYCVYGICPICSKDE